MRLHKDELINGEVMACDNCGREVVMTPMRKMLRKRARVKGRVFRVFCHGACASVVGNREARERKRGLTT